MEKKEAQNAHVDREMRQSDRHAEVFGGPSEFLGLRVPTDVKDNAQCLVKSGAEVMEVRCEAGENRSTPCKRRKKRR